MTRPNPLSAGIPSLTGLSDSSTTKARGASSRKHAGVVWRGLDSSPYLSASSATSPPAMHASKNPTRTTGTEKQESGFPRRSFNEMRKSLGLLRNGKAMSQR
jgi:hypothetical protein